LWRFARRQRWISLRSGSRSITLRLIRTNAKARDADLRTRTLFVELACVNARRGPRIARCHEANEHARVTVDVDTSRHASAHTLRIRLQSRPTCQRQRALPRPGCELAAARNFRRNGGRPSRPKRANPRSA
jgi:hypothetical protein